MEKMAEKIDSMVNERRLLRLGYVTRLALNSIDRADRFFSVRSKINRSQIKTQKDARKDVNTCVMKGTNEEKKI